MPRGRAPGAVCLPVRRAGRRDWCGVKDATPARLDFLDACRALAVLAMLFANMMNVFLRHVPHLLWHNEENRLRVLDFPAAVFQFLIGVSLVLFLERRRSAPASAGARVQALRRFVLLMVLGVVLDGIGALASRPRWGVLQTLALGGMIATGLADVSDASIAGITLVILALFSGAVNGDVHHSPVAAVAFVPLTLAGVIVGRGVAARGSLPGFARPSLIVAGSCLVLAAAAYAAGVPFDKVHGTSSFVALATTVSALLLVTIAAVGAAGVRYPAWLLAVGSNALTAWVLLYLLVYYPAWLVFPSWHRLRLVPGMVVTVAALAALSALTVALGRRGIRIPI